METDFIYWRHPSVPGIKIEEVSGGDISSGKTREEMALQLYCENGRDNYREIGHYQNGAPFLYGEPTRISITHCSGLLVVATLAPTPDIELNEFNERTALGVDAERADRSQVLGLRERFLSEAELAMIPPEDVSANVLAWTIKEAAYKAALTEGLDFRRQIRITKMPKIGPAVPVFDPTEFGLPRGTKEIPADFYGEVRIVTDCSRIDAGRKLKEDEGEAHEVILKVYSYMSDDCIVTLAYSSQSAVFSKSAG